MSRGGGRQEEVLRRLINNYPPFRPARPTDRFALPEWRAPQNRSVAFIDARRALLSLCPAPTCVAVRRPVEDDLAADSATYAGFAVIGWFGTARLVRHGELEPGAESGAAAGLEDN